MITDDLGVLVYPLLQFPRVPLTDPHGVQVSLTCRGGRCGHTAPDILEDALDSDDLVNIGVLRTAAGGQLLGHPQLAGELVHGAEGGEDLVRLVPPLPGVERTVAPVTGLSVDLRGLLGHLNIYNLPLTQPRCG